MNAWPQLISKLRFLVRLPLTLTLCVALVLPGCAGMGGSEPDDPNDVCRPERAAMRSTGDYFNQDIIQGAAVGAVGGGLIGLAAGGNARSLALGMVSGAVAGAIGGYWRARQQQYEKDQAALYASIYGDLERENRYIDDTQAAFNRLTACRNNEALRIRTDYRAGRIDRGTAAAMMEGVKARAQSDLRLARSIQTHIVSRGNDFTYANTQVQQSAPASYGGARAPVRGRQTVARGGGGSASSVQAATSTNVAKRDQFEQSIARAQSNTSAFELPS